jgi:hypothetical protein
MGTFHVRFRNIGGSAAKVTGLLARSLFYPGNISFFYFIRI